MTERAEAIARLLRSQRANVSQSQYVEFIDILSDFDDPELVEIFRVAWVILAFRCAGDESPSFEVSPEGRLYFMKAVHAMAGEGLDSQ